jgi:hypothetical protein
MENCAEPERDGGGKRISRFSGGDVLLEIFNTGMKRDYSCERKNGMIWKKGGMRCGC